jgi:hypothetical protein
MYTVYDEVYIESEYRQRGGGASAGEVLVAPAVGSDACSRVRCRTVRSYPLVRLPLPAEERARSRSASRPQRNPAESLRPWWRVSARRLVVGLADPPAQRAPAVAPQPMSPARLRLEEDALRAVYVQR